MLQNKLEALLFSSGKAMSEEQLAALTDEKKSAVRKALKALQQAYAEREGALKLFQDNEFWKFVVKDDYLPLVRRIVADTELSKATLETLAVIAYHQPNVLQSKVIELRGSGAYDHIKELLELGFITKRRQGRSYALGLTEKFYKYFEVEGEDSIRKIFTSVKRPKEKQQQLGNLTVVDALPESLAEEKSQKEVLGNLEVVDEPVGDESVESATEPTAKLETTPEEEREKSDFLKELEEKIDKLAARNDEREQDESLKPSSREETSEEEPAQESATEETVPDKEEPTPEKR